MSEMKMPEGRMSDVKAIKFKNSSCRKQFLKKQLNFYVCKNKSRGNSHLETSLSPIVSAWACVRVCVCVRVCEGMGEGACEVVCALSCPLFF